MVDTLAVLRERIRSIEGRPAIDTTWVPSGVAALDQAAGGLPRPGVVEVLGAPGNGRTRLALALVAACTRRDPVAWIDGPSVFFPPTASTLGVSLERLIVLRPAAERSAWAVEQVLRSGCFPLVVVEMCAEIPAAPARWLRAVQTGACTLLVVGEHQVRDLQVCLRLSVGRGLGTVQRHRSGRIGASFVVPPWPEGTDPWG